MSAATDQATQTLQQMFEMQAGAVVTGPDAAQLKYTFDGQKVYELSYLGVMLGGFATEADMRTEVQRFVMSREFNVLGNPVRLQKAWNAAGAVEGIPQGPILIWRQGHTISVTSDGNGWSVSMAYAVLPPYARLAT